MRVLEEAGVALARRPRSLEAAFNQALVLEYLGPKGGAIALWQKYLAADSTSQWAAEARTHLDVAADNHETRIPIRRGSNGRERRQSRRRRSFAVYGAIETETLPRWAEAVLTGGTKTRAPPIAWRRRWLARTRMPTPRC